MALAPVTYVLWNEVMNYDPAEQIGLLEIVCSFWLRVYVAVFDHAFGQNQSC